MRRQCYEYRVILVSIGDDFSPETLKKINAMEDEGLIKICAVIKPEGNELVLSVIDGDNNLRKY